MEFNDFYCHKKTIPSSSMKAHMEKNVCDKLKEKEWLKKGPHWRTAEHIRYWSQ